MAKISMTTRVVATAMRRAGCTQKEIRIALGDIISESEVSRSESFFTEIYQQKGAKALADVINEGIFPENTSSENEDTIVKVLTEIKDSLIQIQNNINKRAENTDFYTHLLEG